MKHTLLLATPAVLAAVLVVGTALAQQRRPPPPPEPEIGLKSHIRLWGLQTGELRDRQSGLETPSGMQARAALEDMLEKGEHKVKCRPARWDRECRLVAQCLVETSPSAIDLGGYMLASGMAYGFHLDEVLPWEPRASQRYAGAEAEARKARRGLWPVWLGEKEK